MYIYYLLIFTWYLLYLLYQYSYTSNRHSVYIQEKIKSRYCLYAILPLLCIMGFRGIGVGNDTEQYKRRYDMAEYMLNSPYYQDEYGYNCLGFFFHDILEWPWQSYLIVVSSFMCISLFLFIRKFSVDIYISFFIHLTIGLFVMSMTGIRQTLSVSICMITIVFLFQVEKPGKIRLLLSLVLVYIAYILHNSAFIFYPFIFLSRIRLTKSTVLYLFVFSFFIFFFRGLFLNVISYILPARYSEYALNLNYKVNFLVILVSVVVPLFCLSQISESSDGKLSRKVSFMFLLSAFNFLFISLSMNNNQIGRLAFYFSCNYMILIPEALHNQEINVKSLYKVVIFTLCFIYFIMGIMGADKNMDHYRFFWQS